MSPENIPETEESNVSSTKISWELQDYLTDRLEEQINYHSRKASTSQAYYKYLSLIEIVLAGAIPIILLFPDEGEWPKFTAAVFGALVSIAAGIKSFGQYHNNWLHHRVIAETLKAEEVKFLTRQACYENISDNQALCKLVETIESILDKDVKAWQQQNRRAETATKSKEHQSKNDQEE